MRRIAPLLSIAVAAALAGAGCGGSAGPAPPPPAADAPDAPSAQRGPSVLRGPIELIDGGRLPVARLRGRVVLVVNTASRCGFTPQFGGLQELSASRRDAGLSVIGFPSDDFDQELDDATGIAEFCELNYGVDFPMAAPGRVTGADAQPLFRAIVRRPGPAGAEPEWNFTKYVLDRRGRLVARFASWVEPDDPRIVATVDRLLAEEVGDPDGRGARSAPAPAREDA